jgi:hypothetical protein
MFLGQSIKEQNDVITWHLAIESGTVALGGSIIAMMPTIRNPERGKLILLVLKLKPALSTSLNLFPFVPDVSAHKEPKARGGGYHDFPSFSIIRNIEKGAK